MGSLSKRATGAAQRPMGINLMYQAQLRVSAQCLKKYLLMCIEQKALCVHPMGNPFACWIWTPHCQTKGAIQQKQICQAPNLPAGLERISPQGFARLFQICF